MTNKDLSKRTLELKKYLLSEQVSFDSTEFLPFAAAVQVLETTPPTIKHRIDSGELEEKSFFFVGESTKMYRGVEMGGVKTLLVRKLKQKEMLEKHLKQCLKARDITTYADLMDYAGMSWRLAPETKYCNQVLEQLNKKSYSETVDSGLPCLVSAIVVSRNEHIPTDGFFQCAEELGLIDHNVSKEEKIEFWESQRDLAFNLYGE